MKKQNQFLEHLISFLTNPVRYLRARRLKSKIIKSHRRTQKEVKQIERKVKVHEKTHDEILKEQQYNKILNLILRAIQGKHKRN